MNNTLNFLLQCLISLPIYWSITGLFLIKGGDKVLVGIISTAVIAKIIFNIYNRIQFKFSITATTPLILIAALYGCFSYYYHSYSSSELRVTISTLLYFTLAMPSKKYIPLKLLSITLFISSTIILYNTYNFAFILNASRGAWSVNAIPYATFNAVLMLISLGLFLSIEKLKYKVINLLTALFLLSTVIMTDTRGTWLAIFVSLSTTVYLLYKHKTINKRWIYTSFFLVTIGIIFSYPTIKDRIVVTNSEFQMIKNNNLSSSMGLRVQMWRYGLKIIYDSPSFIGLGQSKHISMIHDDYKKGEVSKSLNNFDNKNLHNSYIDRTVKYGFIGLFIFLSFIFIPFYHGFKTNNIPCKIILISMPLLISVAGLTYIPLSHPGTFFVYLFILNTLAIYSNNIKEFSIDNLKLNNNK